MYILNKQDFYVKYPAQVKLPLRGLGVIDTYGYFMASKILKDAGINCTILDWEDDTGKEQPVRSSPDQVIEYNGEEVPYYYESSADRSHTIHYPNIQPTGWEVQM